jgi:hypothetical protein
MGHFMSDEIVKVLKELARSAEARPMSARLKDYIEDIDAAIAAGVRPEAIEKALADFGIELSPTGLRGALYRFRKKRRAQAESAPMIRPVDTETPALKLSLSLDTTAQRTVTERKPGAYKSDLSAEEKEILKSLNPNERIEFFRQRETQSKFIHNPTPERFRHKGD